MVVRVPVIFHARVQVIKKVSDCLRTTGHFDSRRGVFFGCDALMGINALVDGLPGQRQRTVDMERLALDHLDREEGAIDGGVNRCFLQNQMDPGRGGLEEINHDLVRFHGTE